MDHRPLGSTGLNVSSIGYGAFKIGRNEKVKYPRGYALPDEDEVSWLLNGVLDMGINLIDTAPAYGQSESLIGKHIAHRRDAFVLVTKFGERFEAGRSSYDFTQRGIQESVDSSLGQLRTDAVDVLLIHSDGQDMHILEQTDAVPSLLSLKMAGKTRLIGMSGKTAPGAMAALAWADVLMVEYHSQDESHAEVLAAARKQSVGVLVKKPLAAGRLSPAEAIPFILRQEAVSSVVTASLSLEHMRENVGLASSGPNT